MPRYWKLVDAMPPPISPAANSSPTENPCPAAWLRKIDPSSTSSTAGSENTNATACFSRKNDRSSMPVLARPVRHALGSPASPAVRAAAAVTGSAVIAGLRSA